MSLLHFRRVERRRTARAVVCTDVLLFGQLEDGEKFKYWTKSVSVSHYGGVVVLDAELAVGQEVYVMNEFNGKKAKAIVRCVRSTKEGQVHASFEFTEAVDRFWSMVFPPSGAKALRRVPGKPTI